MVRSELLGLQVNNRGTHPSSGPSHHRTRTVQVELKDLAFRVRTQTRVGVSKDLQDSVIHSLMDKVSDQERREVEKVRLLHTVLKSVATDSHHGGVASPNSSAVSLKDIIGRYFDTNGLSASDLSQEGIVVTPPRSELSDEDRDAIGRDVVTMVSRFSDQSFTGRAVARIFQGIPSPNFPAIVWGPQRGFWRKYLHMDFHTLSHLATSKLLELR